MNFKLANLQILVTVFLLIGGTSRTFAEISLTALPTQRVLTDTSGRKLDVTILEKDDTSIKVRRVSDSKEFSLDLNKLSAEDREFAKGLQPAPLATTNAISPGQTQMEITVCGSQVKVTRLGNGPLGVIFFGHTGWDRIIPTIVAGASEFDGLLPEKASFFLWDYPDQRDDSPFIKTDRALAEYDKGDTAKVRPDFKGITISVLTQIRQQTGIKQFLLVGNSLGAGVILWDYPELVKDPLLKFLLISPTEPFMPLIPTLVKLERTMLLTGVEDPTGRKEFPDGYMKGKDACRWAKANTDESAIKKINESMINPAQSKNGIQLRNGRQLGAGHIIIGNEIKIPILTRLIKVNLGLSPSSLLAKPLAEP